MPSTTPTPSARRLATVAACSVLTIGAAVAVIPGPGGAQTAHAADASFTAVADTHVSSSASGNYGAMARVRVDAKPDRQAFFRFAIKGLTGPVISARLRLHSTDNGVSDSPSGGDVRTTSDTKWSEGITWKQRPEIDGSVLGTIGAVQRNTWYEVDVTSAVRGDGTYSFAVTSKNTNGVEYDTRESGPATAPQLVVKAGGSGGTTTTRPGGPTTTTPGGSTTTIPRGTTTTIPHGTTTTKPPSSTTTTQPPTGQAETFVGAGDIAICGRDGDDATAKLLDKIPGTVFAAGDNVYDSGTAKEYKDCYGPTWGRHLDRTHAVPGNHEYKTSAAKPYYDYFGPERGGEPGKGWHSIDLGAWHIVFLNSNCGDVSGGCGSGSAQVKWLEQDLSASTKECTAAVWHHPRFSSGKHGSNTSVTTLYEVLNSHGAEMVVAGHDHSYERFAPMDAGGKKDDKGIRSFVVGTGGKSHYAFAKTAPNREAGSDTVDGVMKFTLKPGGYDWDFVATPGYDFKDSGSGTCH